jgi:ABC-type branched-subunit amino acid transport system substrate-binding protein
MTTARSVRFASLALAASLVTSACTSSRDEKSSTGPSGDTTRTASALGVTADTIKIGFTYPDLEELATAGVIKTDWGPVEEVVKALVDDVNAEGGVNGRKLQVTFAKYFPPSNTEQLTACNKLTEDDQVFAVLGGFIGDLNTCITQQHSTILISGYGTGFNENALAKARAPWATWLASDERSTKALVKLLDANGKLEGHTIGIYAQQTTAESLADLTREALGDAGYEVVDTAVNDVQSTDIQAFNAQEKLLGERFRDKNVDTVIVVGGAPPGTNWGAVGFHPSL